VDRFYLVAPALLLFAFFAITLVVYWFLCALGRTPKTRNVKHNQFFGPFMGAYLVWIISPIEKLLAGRVSPNAITAASLACCAVTGLAAGLGHLSSAIWFYVLAGVTDVLDGRLARLHNQQTPAGALFDSVSDRWGELFVFTGYAWYLHESPWMLAVLLAISGSMMVSYTRARAEGLGIELSGGVMQRAERIVLVALGTLVAAWYGIDPEQAELVAPILGGTMLLCGAASAATAVNRWIQAFRILAKDGKAIAKPAPAPAASSPEPEPSEPPAIFPVPQKLRESAEMPL
jgi:phosphatidylglycerophosphate synthase